MASLQDTQARLSAGLADRYRIEAEVDSGGMATVYRARDLKHDRTVAIKVLRPDLAQAIGADRFLREIRTTANLNHPHILPLFDSGDAGGLLFYVMPFVEGESLRDRLQREGQLPIEDAVLIAREVADALAYAHKRGVIHRDVKPANILLDEGHAALADFGIAQAKAGVEETRLTGSGMSLGTPSYMSPEQVSGVKEVDGRADQYALGCVLYEMLAGHAPFTGADIQTVMRQHLVADLPSVTQARASVPKGVAKVVHRSLAKTPADRFRTMGEMETALAGATLPLLARIPMGRARAVGFAAAFVLVLTAAAVVVSIRGPAEPALPEDHVAVFPFVNRTGDPELDLFGMMMAEMITHRLEWEDGVTVQVFDLVERMQTRMSDATFLEIALELGVGTAITGSVVPHGDSLVIRAQLSRVPGGDVVDAVEGVGHRETFREVVEDVTDRISTALVISLDVWQRLLPTSPVPTYDAYQENRRGWEEFRALNHEAAIAHHYRAYELDTTFVHALIAAQSRHANLGQMNAVDSLGKVLRGRWGELTPYGRDWVKYYERAVEGDRQGKLDVARAAFERSADAFWGYIIAMEAPGLGRPEVGIRALEQVDFDDPRFGISWLWTVSADAFHYAGRYREELEVVREGQKRHPESLDLALSEVRALIGLEDLETIWPKVDRIEDLPTEGSTYAGYVLMILSAELGRHDYPEEARVVAERAVEWYEAQSPGRYVINHARALMMVDRWADALELAEDAGAATSENLALRGAYAVALARTGDLAAAELHARWFEELDRPGLRGEATYRRAVIAAHLDQKDKAVDLLRRSFEEGMSIWVMHPNPYLSPLWGYERFEDLVRTKG